jgi:hypothetical protein
MGPSAPLIQNGDGVQLSEAHTPAATQVAYSDFSGLYSSVVVSVLPKPNVALAIAVPNWKCLENRFFVRAGLIKANLAIS